MFLRKRIWNYRKNTQQELKKVPLKILSHFSFMRRTINIYLKFHQSCALILWYWPCRWMRALCQIFTISILMRQDLEGDLDLDMFWMQQYCHRIYNYSHWRVTQPTLARVLHSFGFFLISTYYDTVGMSSLPFLQVHFIRMLGKRIGF